MEQNQEKKPQNGNNNNNKKVNNGNGGNRDNRDNRDNHDNRDNRQGGRNRHHFRNRNRDKKPEQKQKPSEMTPISEELAKESIYAAPTSSVKSLFSNEKKVEEEVTVPENYDFDDDSILFGTSRIPVQTEPSENTTEVIGVRFKKVGKVYYFAAGRNKAKRGDRAIVETARGLEFGEVWLSNRYVPNEEIVPPLRPLIRIATFDDLIHNEENHKKEAEAFRIGNEKIAAHKLDMKLVDVQYTFDNSKLLFYFTSAGRVDFRELVKDLASVFHTRIELRQIGIRDEAKLIGGLGACGRPLCCANFLSNFGQVSIKMAKEQNLSLNSSKISGNCGRLMCCLHYEHSTYEEEIRLTPPVDSVVKTPDGVGTVCEIMPLSGMVKVRIKDSDGMPKAYHRDNVTVISRQSHRDRDKDGKSGGEKQ